jgi:hypothetical protein
LAERLAIIDPAHFDELEDLRRELIEVIEERLDESEFVPWAKAGIELHFLRSQIVVFDTHQRIEQPVELVDLIPQLSISSIFYHFIDARRRTPLREDDFSYWLKGLDWEYEGLIHDLATVDPYFTTLTEVREQLRNIFRRHLEGK